MYFEYYAIQYGAERTINGIMPVFWKYKIELQNTIRKQTLNTTSIVTVLFKQIHNLVRLWHYWKKAV